MLRAQQALGLLDDAYRDVFARLEEQQPPDDVRAGLDVKLVCETEEPVVLLRVLEVEDVLGDDPDLADAGARGLELGERRDLPSIRGILRARRPGCRQRREADEQVVPNQRDRPGLAW